MRFLSILLFFGGYTLVYAAVANRGLFATEPWLGLFTDAYATPKIQGESKSQGGEGLFDVPGGGTAPFKPPTNLPNPVRPRSTP